MGDCGPFTNHGKRIQNFRETGDLNHIYMNELDKACFAHDASFSDSKDLAKKTAQFPLPSPVSWGVIFCIFTCFFVCLFVCLFFWGGGGVSKFHSSRGGKGGFLGKCLLGGRHSFQGLHSNNQIIVKLHFWKNNQENHV